MRGFLDKVSPHLPISMKLGGHNPLICQILPSPWIGHCQRLAGKLETNGCMSLQGSGMIWASGHAYSRQWSITEVSELPELPGWAGNSCRVTQLKVLWKHQQIESSSLAGCLSWVSSNVTGWGVHLCTSRLVVNPTCCLDKYKNTEGFFPKKEI